MTTVTWHQMQGALQKLNDFEKGREVTSDMVDAWYRMFMSVPTEIFPEMWEELSFLGLPKKHDAVWKICGLDPVSDWEEIIKIATATNLAIATISLASYEAVIAIGGLEVVAKNFPYSANIQRDRFLGKMRPKLVQYCPTGDVKTYKIRSKQWFIEDAINQQIEMDSGVEPITERPVLSERTLAIIEKLKQLSAERNKYL
jgi:hypothetical protein